MSAKGSFRNHTTRFAEPAVLVPVLVSAWGRVWDVAWADGRSSDRMRELLCVLVSGDAVRTLEDAEALPMLHALDATAKAVEEAFHGRLKAFGYFPARIRIITELAHAEYMLIMQEAMRRMGPLPAAEPDTEPGAAGPNEGAATPR